MIVFTLTAQTPVKQPPKQVMRLLGEYSPKVYGKSHIKVSTPESTFLWFSYVNVHVQQTGAEFTLGTLH